ncbi:1-acyl-sn-glycerol-3-phosphate acyltransferase [Bacteriovoracaceae bacterium]|nr:1-acyl-sn-glycerol-3-phosphate acyltransferase [Bacteriovoracaceae bacterium]
MGADELEVALSYPKLSQYLEEHPHDLKKVKDIITEIRGEYNPKVINVAAKFLDRTLLKLYNGINLDVSPSLKIDDLKEKYHVILVPNHQSHADYLALTYILHKKLDLPVYVAGGINLNIFMVGKLFKNSGAFFIRRKFQDDNLYKVTLESYIYYLLKENRIVEFFFEGGRTRTGKLLRPRFGLFKMILEAQKELIKVKDKDLLFVPVSVAHEHIPEESSHRNESKGGKKKPESSKQLFKLFSLLNKKLGTIHIRLNKPILVTKKEFAEKSIKDLTHQTAFDCFKKVGKYMPITPSSLLALTMLDDAIGALTWKQIEERCQEVVLYALQMDIPITSSLRPERISQSLKLALDNFITNEKIQVISNDKLNQVFYAINEKMRPEILYHKNMILHHFLVPVFINFAWFNILNGKVKTERDLIHFLNERRKQLKYEFYLPSIKEMFSQAQRIVSMSLNKEILSLTDILTFPQEDLNHLAESVKRFSSLLTFTYEAYFISAVTAKYLAQEGFTLEKYLEISRELFQIEIEHGRVVKYQESYSTSLMKNTLSYLENKHAIDFNESTGLYTITNLPKIDELIEKFATEINDQMSINLKFGRNDSISPR